MSTGRDNAVGATEDLSEIQRKVQEVYPLAAKHGYDEATLARLAGVSLADIERLSADAACVQALAAEVVVAENDGRLLAPTADALKADVARLTSFLSGHALPRVWGVL